ncbi:MAG: LEA type 2 family protein [Chitinophagales bacterium]|nr:LEA type 2 family protein [Bacteroidota bacterium]MCB9043074.1 LEA type 2 family protein [Chitinophagales bacterium]
MKQLSFFAQILFITLAISSFFACNQAEKPYFKNISNVRINKATIQEIEILSDAVFENPNRLGGTLSTLDIDVYANNILVGNILQNDPINIPANGEFSVPLKVKFAPKKLFSDKGLLTGLAMVLDNKKVDLQFKGNAGVNLAGVDIKFPVEDFQSVYLNKTNE